MKILKHILSGICGFVFAFAVTFAFAKTGNLLFGRNSYDGTKFQRQIWIESSGDHYNNQRCAMLDDLQKYRLAVGLSKDEVIELLGRPEREESNLVAYCIGRNNGFLNDSEWFFFEMNENDIITDFKPGASE